MPFRFNPFTGNLDEVDTTAAAGSNTQVQVNDGGKLAGFIELLWNKFTKVFTVKGDINLDDGGTFATTLQPITPTADRVISFPDATGTLALVAGSSGQLIYNNAGANAGTPTLTYDGSILTSSGRFINSYNATASSPAKAFTGTWFTGGTATTTKPHVLIEPAGTTSTAWDTRGTGLGINAPSGFPGNLLDLQVNGTSNFRVASTGAITTNSTATLGGVSTSSLTVTGVGGSNSFTSTYNSLGITGSIILAGSITVGSNINAGNAGSVNITANNRASDNNFANGVNITAGAPQASATVYTTGGSVNITGGSGPASTQGNGGSVNLAGGNGTNNGSGGNLNLNAGAGNGTGTDGNIVIGSVRGLAQIASHSTVAGLPTSPVIGMLTRVTDASSPTLGATVSGGGSAAALVWYNGANWTVLGV